MLIAAVILCHLAASEAWGQYLRCVEAFKKCSACEQKIALGRSMTGISTDSKGKCVVTEFGLKATDPGASEAHKACQRCLDQTLVPVEDDSLEVVVRRTLRRLASRRQPIAIVTSREDYYRPVSWSAEPPPSPPFRRISFEYTPKDSRTRFRNHTGRIVPGPSNPSVLPRAFVVTAATCDEIKPQGRGFTAQEEAEHAPDMKIIVSASEQRSTELADLLLRFLYSQDENRAVYALMGGQSPNVISNKLAQKLRPNDKLLRYLTARRRYCEQQSQEEWNRWYSSGKVVGQIVFVVMDIVLADLGIFALPMATPLNYIEINIKIQQAGRSAENQKQLTADIQKLILDTVLSIPEMPTRGSVSLSAASTVKTGPIWEYDAMSEYMGSLAQSAGPGLADEAWQRFTRVSDPNLNEEIKGHLNEVQTEGEWLDRMDKERKRMGEMFLWHRAVVARFNAIFEANKWPNLPQGPQLTMPWGAYGGTPLQNSRRRATI